MQETAPAYAFGVDWSCLKGVGAEKVEQNDCIFISVINHFQSPLANTYTSFTAFQCSPSQMYIHV